MNIAAIMLGAMLSSQVLDFQIDTKRVETVHVTLGVATVFEFEGCKKSLVTLSDERFFQLVDLPPATDGNANTASEYIKVAAKIPNTGYEATMAIECADKLLFVVNLITSEKDKAARIVRFHSNDAYDARVAHARKEGMTEAKIEYEAKMVEAKKATDEQILNAQHETLKTIASGFAMNYHENDDEEFGRGPIKSPVYYCRVRVFKEVIIGKHGMLRFEVANRSDNELIVNDLTVTAGKRQVMDILAYALPKRIDPGHTVVGAVLFDMPEEGSVFSLILSEQHGNNIVVGDINF